MTASREATLGRSGSGLALGEHGHIARGLFRRLERFIIEGFLQYYAAAGLVRFAPELWAELRHADVLAILSAADEQLAYYYGRRRWA